MTKVNSTNSQLPRAVILAIAVAIPILSIPSAIAYQPSGTFTKQQRRRSKNNSILQYRQTDEDQPILMQLANGNLAVTEGTIVSSSASSFLQMMSAQDHDMLAMDEYLEYVDKRYARMHPHLSSLTSSPSSPAAPTASVVVHMSTRAPTTDHYDQAPLTTLGLSRLASAQLRHRLRQQHAESRTISILMKNIMSRVLKPFSFVCSAILVVSTFVLGGNGYRS